VQEFLCVCGLPRMAFLARAYNRLMHEVVVYSRKGCHLCDVVKETLTRVQDDFGFAWHEVDIDGDPQLRQRYNDEVPVVFIDGRKAFKYHMDGHQFLRALAGSA
jgi:glutaredoxin